MADKKIIFVMACFAIIIVVCLFSGCLNISNVTVPSTGGPAQSNNNNNANTLPSGTSYNYSGIGSDNSSTNTSTIHLRAGDLTYHIVRTGNEFGGCDYELLASDTELAQQLQDNYWNPIMYMEEETTPIELDITGTMTVPADGDYHVEVYDDNSWSMTLTQ